MPPPDAPLYARVERRVPALARQMIDTFVAEIPLYAHLPREQLDGEILDITAANLRLFFASLREGRELSNDELVEIRVSAARRAEERVPLDAVLTAYHVGGRLGWQALVDDAQPDETDVLIAAAYRVLNYVQQVSAAVAAAYLEEQQIIYGEEHDARRALASALLTGEPAEPLAARLGMHIAPAYLVLSLRVAPHPDEAEPGVGGPIAARRKVRRLQSTLSDLADGPVLTLLDPTGGSALLPSTPTTVNEAAAGLTELVVKLRDAAGAEVCVGGSIATTTAAIPVAAAQAQDIVTLARRLDLPPGGYLLRDVLLEYQLTRPSDAQSALRALLDPIDRNPDLPRTLEVYLAHDLDRRRTAAALHVHPNTLDYRLRRVVELTGLDPSTARGLQLLGAALAARRLGVG
ncbi:MAG TPA: helix-turn-helix domain-containing protein [Mycobacteriales bacterium]|nr:helix-turn-helix domain-containing protein [Mycobacteriales bacterium]